MAENTGYNILHSLYIIFVLIPCINGIPFIIIGLRNRKLNWVIEGIFYTLIGFYIFLYIGNNPTVSYQENTSPILRFYITTWFISIYRAFMIRKEHISLSGGNVSKLEKSKVQETPEVQETPKVEAPKIQETPKVQETQEIETPKTLIDINNATEEEIASLPQINLIQAKKIISLRENGIYFKTPEELKEKLNLNQHQLELITPLIEFKEPKNIKTENKGRKLDI